MRRPLIAAAIVTAGLATAGIAYAESQPADPSVAAGAAGTAAESGAGKAGPRAGGPKAGQRGGILKGAIHGDLLVRADDGSTRTVTFDRGKVTDIAAGSITIERPDGVIVSKNLTDSTVFNGTPRAELKPGAAVVVVSSGDTAERVLSKGDRAEKRLEKRQDRLEKRQERLERRKERIEPSSRVDDEGWETILS